MDSLRRAYAHWYQDGLGEITQSPVFFALGFYYLLLTRLPDGSPLWIIITLTFPLAIIGLVLSTRPLLRLLKVRITAPRVGTVTYRKSSQSKRVLTRLAIGLLLGIALQVASAAYFTWPFDWTIFITGLGFGLIYVYAGYRTSVWRLIIFGIVAILGGFLLSLTGWEGSLALAVFFLFFASLTLIIGLIILVIFIRQHPVIAVDPAELDFTGEPEEILEDSADGGE